jgi:hypothetical protein
MDTLLFVLTCVGWLLAAGMTYVAYRFYRKCVVYDEVFQYLAEDIVTNLKYYQKLLTTPVLSDSDEIKEANRLMHIMGKRLNEILQRMEDSTGLRLRPAPKPPRPKVV